MQTLNDSEYEVYNVRQCKEEDKIYNNLLISAKKPFYLFPIPNNHPPSLFIAPKPFFLSLRRKTTLHSVLTPIKTLLLTLLHTKTTFNPPITGKTVVLLLLLPTTFLHFLLLTKTLIHLLQLRKRHKG